MNLAGSVLRAGDGELHWGRGVQIIQVTSRTSCTHRHDGRRARRSRGTGVRRPRLPLNPLRPHCAQRSPLRSGFVENIHANGPTIYAHEQYVLNGAAPNTTYHVVLMIFPGDTTCSGAPAVSIPTATIQTNTAGNGVAFHVFTPADADGLHGATVGGLWTVSAAARPTTRPGADHRLGLSRILGGRLARWADAVRNARAKLPYPG